MSDQIDLAQQHEAFRRDIALRDALKTEGRPNVVFSVLACLDCDDPIEGARLMARPCAVRCITCQEAWERFRRLHPGS